MNNDPLSSGPQRQSECSPKSDLDAVLSASTARCQVASSEVDQKETEGRRRHLAPTRLAGLGIELASFAFAGGLIGYAVDRWLVFDRPYAALLGIVIGFAFGMVRFIRVALDER